MENVRSMLEGKEMRSPNDALDFLESMTGKFQELGLTEEDYGYIV